MSVWHVCMPTYAPVCVPAYINSKLPRGTGRASQKMLPNMTARLIITSNIPHSKDLHTPCLENILLRYEMVDTYRIHGYCLEWSLYDSPYLQKRIRVAHPSYLMEDN